MREEAEEEEGGGEGRRAFKHCLQRRVSLFDHPDCVSSWWEYAIANSSAHAEHPIVSAGDVDISRVIPYYIHYDGAEMYANSEYHIWSVGSLVADTHGSVFDRLFPVLAIDDALIQDMNQVHNVVSCLLEWSSRALQSGRWPSKGMQNEEFDKTSLRYERRDRVLADGWRAAFVCVLSRALRPHGAFRGEGGGRGGKEGRRQGGRGRTWSGLSVDCGPCRVNWKLERMAREGEGQGKGGKSNRQYASAHCQWASDRVHGRCKIAQDSTLFPTLLGEKLHM